MAFQTLTSQQFTCHPKSTQSISLGVHGGTVMSVGFQNAGNAENFYASQMFANTLTNVYVQVVNNSFSDTSWYIWAVVSITSEQVKATLDSDNVKVEQHELSRPETR